MILYLDTSALVKLYVEENETEVVEKAVEEADSVATSVVAYAEARAGLARKRREGALNEDGHQGAIVALEEDWGAYQTVPVTNNLSRAAGDLAESHALRGFDAIHLASALLIHAAASDQDDEAPDGNTTRFLSFDRTLMAAAGKVMDVYPPSGEQNDQTE